MSDKKCGIRKSKNVDAYTKDELVNLAVDQKGLTKTEARKLKIAELCKILKIKITKSSPKKEIEVDKRRICTPRKLKKYPNAYKKVELISLAKKDLGMKSGDAKKLKIKQLCENLGIEFIDVPVKSVKSVKSEKSEKSVKSVKSEKSVKSSCISRSKLALKDHQIKVVDFLNRPDKRGLLVIHSVGSGKTLTAVTTSQCFLDNNPTGDVIVVTPTSLQANFKKELIAYGGDPEDSRYKFYTIQGFTNASKKGEINCKKSLLILDEAHNIRAEVGLVRGKQSGVNAKFLIECAKKAKKVLLLTATPLVNRPSEIINLMAMVEGKDPVKEGEFKDYDLQDLENYFNCKVSIFSPPEEEIAKYYPESEVHDVYIKMSSEYLKKYEEVEQDTMDESSRGLFGDSNIKAFYNGVRRASNNLEEKKSPKVVWIMDLVNDSKKTDKFVIFSHFLEAGLKLLMKRLTEQKIKFLHIDGSMSQKKRQEAVKEYNEGKIKVLLISKAGGEGLDLKNTRYVIIMEPAWNESTHKQVIGRAVRYKSHFSLPEKDRKVDIYRLFMIKPYENDNINRIVQENWLENNDADDLLSVDLYLRNLAIFKQQEIDKFMEIIKESSIENKLC
jgi:SNF2 family DNA or RNA helicase